MSLEDGPIVPMTKPERRSATTHEFDHGPTKVLDSGQIVSQVIGQMDKGK